MSLEKADGTPIYNDATLASVSSLESDPRRVLSFNIYEDGPTTANGGYVTGQTTGRLLAKKGAVLRASEVQRLLTKGSAAPVFTVSNKALTSNVATLTTTAPHGFKVGAVVVVAGVDATFNGTYTVTAVTGTTLSFAKVAANVASTGSAGTVRQTLA